MLHESDGEIQTDNRSFKRDRDRFDGSVRKFLTGSVNIRNSGSFTGHEVLTGLQAYTEGDALKNFFKDTKSPMAILLSHLGVQSYLQRPISRVEFKGDAYEPELSPLERRIYNLAAATGGADLVPFRYIGAAGQNAAGDMIAPEAGKDDIIHHFGTRRADPVVANMLTYRLEAEAEHQNPLLPIHVIRPQGRIIEDCLKAAKEHALTAGHGSQCYVIQARHGTGDRELHFGTLLAVLGGGNQQLPQKLIFFDTIKRTSGAAVYEKDFLRAIDNVFPAAPGKNPVSAMAEDGSVQLMRPDHGNVMRNADRDCSFYTYTIARALIQTACAKPDLLLHGNLAAIKTDATGRIPEYFSAPNYPKSPSEIRQASIKFRWEMGREALKNIAPVPLKVPQVSSQPAPGWVYVTPSAPLPQPLC